MSISKEILINVTPQETRVAILENGMLHEMYVERSRSRGIVGNVYRGKVARVLPGMEAAFIEIGLERAAFLHVSDVAGYKRQSSNSDSNDHSPHPQIGQLLREGQDISVQVIKDPLGTKGARLTTNITIPSRYLVFMPNSENIGVSSRIESEEERERLRNLLLSQKDLVESAGYIIRTAAEVVTEESIGSDVKYLNKQWEKIKNAQDIEAGNFFLELHLYQL